MLATIHNDTWNVLSMQHITPNLKDGIINLSSVVAIKRLKDLPTWLRMATTLEMLPTPTHLIPASDLPSCIWPREFAFTTS